NIMSALLAKRLGAKRTIVLLDRQVYSNIVYGTDIDVTVSLTQTSLGELLRHIRYGDVVSAQEMYRGGAEAIEIVAHGSQKSSKIVGRRLSEIVFPPGVSTGAVYRGEGDEAQILMAEPNLEIQSDDHLIMFIPSKKVLSKLETLFAVDVGFF
ncbi:MAG TPA: Trk system potassium transport protein TrkA, partial [Sutterella sp.]|nr:Trk system potassium transport protein TrkA [Sutterella sp.]